MTQNPIIARRRAPNGNGSANIGTAAAPLPEAAEQEPTELPPTTTLAASPEAVAEAQEAQTVIVSTVEIPASASSTAAEPVAAPAPRLRRGRARKAAPSNMRRAVKARAASRAKKPRGRAGGRAPALNKTESKKLAATLRGGKTLAQTAKIFKVSVGTVRRYAKLEGVKMTRGRKAGTKMKTRGRTQVVKRGVRKLKRNARRVIARAATTPDTKLAKIYRQLGHAVLDLAERLSPA